MSDMIYVAVRFGLCDRCGSSGSEQAHVELVTTDIDRATKFAVENPAYTIYEVEDGEEFFSYHKTVGEYYVKHKEKA